MKPPWDWRQHRAIASAFLVGLAGGIALLIALLLGDRTP